MSNLIQITKIYDIYPKYTFSKDVMRFMDDIVDIPRAEVFTKDEVIDMIINLKEEITNIYESSGIQVYNSEKIDFYFNVLSKIDKTINSLRDNKDE